MTPDSEGLHPIANTENCDREADIVFVHGLGGASHSTWRHGKEGKDGHFFWPEELGKDLPQYGIWTVGYPAGFTALGKPGMIIEKRAGNLSLKLSNAGLGVRPLLFITHSMGGLVVKSLIVGSQTIADSDRKRLVGVIRGIVFCATPHRGSCFADAAGVLGKFFGGSQDYVCEMRANAEPLDILHDQFIEWYRTHSISVDSYAENIGLFRTRWWSRPLPLGLVVPRASANPGLEGHTVRDVDDDHLTLVKPSDRNHDVFAGVFRFIPVALTPRPILVMFTLKLPDDFNTFSEEKKEELRLLLAREANVTPSEIAITQTRPGSTKVDLQITEDVANKLFAKFATGLGALSDRGIIKLDAEMQKGQGAKLVSLRRLAKMNWIFVGREDELLKLDQIAEQSEINVVTIVALGGIGKTTLVAAWLSQLATRDWAGFEMVFDWSFYSQGSREQTAASSDLFLNEALAFFGDPEAACSARHASEKGRLLAKLVGERRALLILDGVEPLQYSPTSPLRGEFKDQGLAALLKGLAANSRGLCLVTTRYSIRDLKAFQQTTSLEINLLRLSQAAGVSLLKALGVKGTQQEFDKLVEDVQGHALTLNMFGGFLKRAFNGDIRRRDRVKFEQADAHEPGGHTFRTMAAYEQCLLEGGHEGLREVAVLRLMGLFDRPVDASCINALRGSSIPELTEPLAGLADVDWEISLRGLEEARLLKVNRDATGSLVALDAHPLLREYFAHQLRTQYPDAWRAGHRRLYEHLCVTTNEGEQPSLEGLQPLYQAVNHGCQAGMQMQACDEVFFARIRRGNKAYSIEKLGAFGSDLGAIVCFFETPWSCVSSALSEGYQAWLLNEAAFCLRALGRLSEALAPMRAGLEMGIKQETWINAAIIAGNLSELELSLGDMKAAVVDAEQSVAYANRCGDAFRQLSKRTTHANSLHQSGRRAEAQARFKEAEAMQTQRQHDYPLLYSLPGFQYCDLLLSAAERAAWQKISGATMSPEEAAVHGATLQSVFQRASQTIQWAEQNNLPLLSIALDHLTLGRCVLYAAILEGSSLVPCSALLQQAVDGLRRSGNIDELPRGLLFRAWLRSLEVADHDGAQADLDEALEIAERGPMALHMADIHLHRARLFGNQNALPVGGRYPWESPQADLSEARRLIVKHGYLRRMEELEDAERAILK